MIFILTGCGAKYQINITNDGIEEQIDFETLVTKDTSDNPLEMDYNSLDFIESIKLMDIKALVNNDNEFYEKKITNDDDLYNIHFSYKYKGNDYVNSRVVNECFENHEIKFNDKKIYIHLSGNFYWCKQSTG